MIERFAFASYRLANYCHAIIDNLSNSTSTIFYFQLWRMCMIVKWKKMQTLSSICLKENFANFQFALYNYSVDTTMQYMRTNK